MKVTKEAMNEAQSLVARVKSMTDPGKQYEITKEKPGRWSCSCPDWVHRRSKDPKRPPCKHLLALWNQKVEGQLVKFEAKAEVLEQPKLEFID